jgi:hypothetical protein
MVMIIIDQGVGFDWKATLKKVKNATDDLDATSGRGFPLMIGYGYEPSLNEIGNQLQLTTQRP